MIKSHNLFRLWLFYLARGLKHGIVLESLRKYYLYQNAESIMELKLTKPLCFFDLEATGTQCSQRPHR